MKILKNNQMFKKAGLTIFYSFIFSIGLQFFIQPFGLIATGVSGITQIVEHITHVKYGILYLLLNIPGLIIGYIYIGKKFTNYSILSIATVSITTYFVPPINIIGEDAILLGAIFGGILIGYSIGNLLKIGSSSGGTDFFAVYLLRYKNREFARMNLIINIVIILLGAWFNGLEAGLYTLVSLYIRNTVLDQTFTNTQTITLFIVGPSLDEVSDYINNELHRGTTIIKNVEGGYTHNRKEIIMTTVNYYEYSALLDEIGQINSNIFINVVESKQIIGNYSLTKEKNEDA